MSFFIGTAFLLLSALEVSSFKGLWKPFQLSQPTSLSRLFAATQVPAAKSPPGEEGNDSGDDFVKRYHTEAFPWGTSVVPDRDLTYIRMAIHQLGVLKENGFEEVDLSDLHRGRTSEDKQGRLLNMQFESSVFRKVRMTYFDAGNHVQVFNTLWYPRYEYDAPMFGVDLISLGKNRILNVMDFQPIFPHKEYKDKYVTPLKNIRSKYEDLQGNLSGKIYDDEGFFSEGLLFGRFTDETRTNSVILPAFMEAVGAYVELCSAVQPDTDPARMQLVKNRQQSYDSYSAAKDPAVGIFGGYFGQEWAHEFIHNFLFELAEKKEVKPAHNFHVDNDGKATVMPRSPSDSPNKNRDKDGGVEN